LFGVIGAGVTAKNWAYSRVGYGFGNMGLIRMPWAETHTTGSSIGLKTFLNKRIDCLWIYKPPQDALSKSSKIILNYAMRGFVNVRILGSVIARLASVLSKKEKKLLGSV
jgi:nucleoside permease NupC